MKLLVLSAYFESQGGGVEKVAGAMVRAAARLGHAVSWAATSHAPPPRDADCQPLAAWDLGIRRLGVPTPIPRPSALRRLVGAVGRCDALILHDCLYLPNVAAFLIARWRGKPVVVVQHIASVTYRNLVLRGLMRAGNALITRPMLASADQVVFISHSVAAAFADVRYRTPPAVIFNGVDAARFHPAAQGEAGALKQSFGLDPHKSLILFVGRFVEKKGLHTLRRMAAAFPQHGFVLAGHGPMDPLSWGLPNVVAKRDLGGDDLARLYRAADLFVLPSRGEGYPLVIQEALASGLPLLCSAEIVAADPGIARFAIAVDAEQPDAAAQFVDRLPRALQGAGASAADRRAHALAHYPQDGLTEGVVRRAQELSGRRARARGAATSWRFGVVSGACAGLNLILLALGDAAGWSYLASGCLAFGLVVIFGFLAHSAFTFARPPGLARFLRYLGAMSMAAPLHAAILWVACGQFGASALAGGVLSLLLLTVWNFAGVSWALRGLRE